MKLLFTILTLLIYCENVLGYKVLYLFPFASKSHKIVFDSLLLELAHRNHEVTVVTTYKFPQQVRNVKEIIIEDVAHLKSPDTQKMVFSAIGIHPLLMMFIYPSFTIPFCKNYLENKEVKKLIENGKQFDVVFVSSFLNECALATAPLLGEHVISHNAGVVIPWSGVFVPAPPSYVPHILLSYTSEMGFFQRVDNFITNVGVNLIYDYYLIPKFQAEISKNVPQNPSIFDARRKVVLYLTIADPVFTSPRPTMPNIVSIRGIHCKKAKPLPNELEDFIQSSGDDGFIYFSLGSNAQSRYLPDDIKKSIVTVFSKLKQKVIWKYEEELENASGNIKVLKWAPQQDLLGHPKIRGFITHGGLLSLQEAVYHAVPVVAIPIVGDQPGNVARMEELKIGVKVDFNNISGESILDALHIILRKSYKDNVKKYSAIFRDQNQDPVEKAIFWIDSVVLHGGVDHLKSAGEELTSIQYFLIDVILFISVILIFITCIFIFIGKLICKKVFSSKKSNSKKTSSKKRQ